nr:hypothetical protein BaRGS_001271 [Batillaria attramentaria]
MMNDSLAKNFENRRVGKSRNATSGGGAGGGDGGESSSGPAMYPDFTAEYAKSNRSTCRGCNEKIDKDEVRLSKKDYESQRAKMYGPQDMWHHVDCFVKERDELEFDSDMNPEK